MSDTIHISLRGTFGYRDANGETRYYGPGDDIPVPIGLARALGKVPAPAVDRSPALPDSRATIFVPNGGISPDPISSETFPAQFAHVDLLIAAGYTTPDAVRAASDEELLAIEGVGAATLRRIRAALA